MVTVRVWRDTDGGWRWQAGAGSFGFADTQAEAREAAQRTANAMPAPQSTRKLKQGRSRRAML